MAARNADSDERPEDAGGEPSLEQMQITDPVGDSELDDSADSFVSPARATGDDDE